MVMILIHNQADLVLDLDQEALEVQVQDLDREGQEQQLINQL